MTTKGPRGRVALTTAVTAISIALVCVATVAFTIYVPATEGYFNLGETMVYTVAILFGPYVGALAGGIGSALADLLLGYAFYAPATLVIKACEGFTVGWLIRKARIGEKAWKGLTVATALLSGSSLSYVGMLYYSGDVWLYLGRSVLEGHIPAWVWLCLGVALAIFIISLGLALEPETGWKAFSILVGGCIMVLGYFLYEFLWFSWAALAEVPINIGQMTIGLAVALPLTRALEERLPEPIRQA